MKSMTITLFMKVWTMGFRTFFVLVFLLFASAAYAVDYDSITVLKDMGTSTPTGDENPRVIDDVDRMFARLIHAEHHTRVLTASGTATASDTYIIGSSSSAIVCTLPLASTVGDGTTTKHFIIKNRGAGTMTLSPTIDGVGSPTVSQNGTMVVFTDGTSWFEQRAKNAEVAGTATTATNALLLNAQASSYYTNSGNQDAGTLPLARIPATLTGKDADTLDGQEGSYYTNSGNQSSGTLPLARLPSTLTGKDADTLDTIDSTGFVQANTTYLKQWQCEGTTGTGTLNFVPGIGINLTPTYDGNGQGTITTTASGTATAGGWVDTGTQTISTAGQPIVARGTLTVTAGYGVSGLLDSDVPNNITLDNLTQITTRNYNDLSGTGTIHAHANAWRNAVLSVATGTWTQVPFDATATVYNASHSTSSFPEHVTVLVAGKYLATAVVQIRMANGAAGIRTMINDSVIGTGSVRHGYFNYGDGNTGGEVVSSCVLDLNANDFVSLQVCHNSADNPKTILDANWGASGMPANTGSTTASLTLIKVGP